MKKLLFLLSALAVLGAAPLQDMDAEMAGLGSKWVNVSPAGEFVILVVPFARNPKEFQAITYNGNIYRSANSGVSWTRKGQAGGGWPRDFAVSPADDRRLYVLYETASMRTSGDGGATWTDVAFPGSVTGFAVSPASPRTLWAAGWTSVAAIFRSEDDGLTWTTTAIDPGRTGTFTETRLFPAPDPRVMYATVNGSTPRVYRSLDGGASWADVSGSLGACFSAAIDPRDPMTLLATAEAPDGPAVFRSSDGGASWTRSSLRTGAWKLVADPRADGVYYALDPESADLFRSEDEGWSFQWAGSAFFSVGILAAPRGLVSFGTVGVSRSLNRGETWKPANRGLNRPPIDTVAASGRLLFADRMAFGLLRSRNGGKSWTSLVKTADLTAVSKVWISPASARRVLALNLLGLRESEDGGLTWDLRLSRIRDFDAAAPAGRFRVCALSDEQPLAVALSDDLQTWTEVAIPTDPVESPLVVAVAPSDPDRIYVGTDQGVHVTADGGATWSASLAGSVIGALAVDPADPSVVYAGVQGGLGTPGLFRSADGGLSWTRRSGIDVRSIRVDAARRTRVFAGGNDGVFISPDSGLTWSSLNNGLAIPQAYVVAYDAPRRLLYAATWQGLWRKRA